LIIVLIVKKRNLSSASASQSTVYGTGVGGTIEAFTSYTVNVDAKDSSGNSISTGGETFMIEIRNKWALASNFDCIADGSAKQALTSVIYEIMTDLGNGTYTYSYSVLQSGEITVLVQLLSAGGVYSEWFENSNWSGVPSMTSVSSDINYDWGAGDVIPGIADFVSAKFYAKLKPPTTDTYTFYLIHDDGSKLELNGVAKIDRQGVVWIWEDQFSETLTGGVYHDLKIEYFENAGGAILKLEWSSGTGTILRQPIPSTYYSFPEYVGASPYQVTSSWPTGYSGTEASSPNQWALICGDGLRVGTELCDDGNIINGDGCQNTWSAIDANWVWDGGSTTSADFWEECSIGFVQNNVVTPRYWVEIWGDGRRVGKELWDDSNTVDGDGWASNCTIIESGWVCSGGNANNRDICENCPDGYSQNYDKSGWVPSKIPTSIATASTLTSVVVALGISLSIVNALMNNSSISGSFSMLNAVQLILLLPLIGAYLPDDVLSFIRGMDFSLMNFDIFDFYDSKNIDNQFGINFDFEQADPYLYLIGLESGSTLINMMKIVELSMIIPMLHIWVAVAFWILKRRWDKSKWYFKFISNLLKGMTFGVYIMQIYEIYIFAVLASLSEVKNSKQTTLSRRYSRMIAITLIVLCCIFLLLSVYQWIKTFWNNNLKSMHYFIYFFSGIRGTWKARLYAMMFILRRSLLWSIVIFLDTKNGLFYKTLFFVTVQFLYLSLSIIIRPFSEVKDNICEIINEVVYTILWGSLFYLNAERRWSEISEKAYISLIMFNNLMFSFIAFGKICFITN
jgi:cysteine-rich repeat protein